MRAVGLPPAAVSTNCTPMFAPLLIREAANVAVIVWPVVDVMLCAVPVARTVPVEVSYRSISTVGLPLLLPFMASTEMTILLPAVSAPTGSASVHCPVYAVDVFKSPANVVGVLPIAFAGEVQALVAPTASA